MGTILLIWVHSIAKGWNDKSYWDWERGCNSILVLQDKIKGVQLCFGILYVILNGV